MKKKINNIRIKTIITNVNIYLIGCISIQDNKKNKINRKNINIKVNNHKYKMRFPFKRIMNVKYLRTLSNLYITKIPVNDVVHGEIHNIVKLVYKHNGKIYSDRLKYSRREKKYLNERVKIIKKINTSIYIRQSIGNNMFITVRKINRTDKFLEQIKINISYIISKFLKANNIVLLYEKESSRYEESASVIYEYLLDNGYSNSFYVIDRKCKDFIDIAKKYKKNVIYKYSFKHYLYFFKAKTFMGTEALVHSIELRVANKYAVRRINSKSLNFIFLQHGVTYMVPLVAKIRSAFHKKETNAIRKVVVSSKLEAQHFIDCANYSLNDIYICGLPKFDKNKWNKDADKIIIMPTWRPWEYNQSRLDFTESKYYKMVSRIFKSIPDKYKNNVIILPHPLIAEMITEFEDDMKKYMNFKDKYDDLLQQAKVLITDYSSISYDAFYRGSNVIFYWEEKDYCMEQYGEGTKLMLNEENCFGDICYTPDKLSEVIEKNYLQNQSKKYIDNYRKIVEFNDNKNTERLISYLKKDKLI
ncbi:CDP-glycerol glycerophosphotransferase family protein [Terrisporobacter vanillatitrophus]|uniref:CDP-glycerol glycerophosphotransferase family protein n=1 Tax=Terrisporobacter vanillatitrophus TaxID=3058402 RepID=UPI003365B6F6